jgi:tRNA A-37 threonylcarbamoyl transferase component Bud32/tetratricopeptide (TPR) repeat protein
MEDLNSQQPDGTMPDIDISPAEALSELAGDPAPSPGNGKAKAKGGRPAWISSILGSSPDEEQAPKIIPLEPGFQIPGTRYQLVDWLGDGGMGVVYEASHVDLDRIVALKVIREKYCRDRELKDMFRAEARAASRVGSEHIVQIYDFAELPDGRLAFAMELLRGPLLKEEIKAQPFDAPRAIGVLRQICKGLAAAHEARVVHRDIKPGNIVLETVKGRRDTVKILDFGIATIMADDAVDRDRGGTPLYVAPELIQGDPADPRADIYSLGCTAFEMLTGRTPYTGANAKEVLLAHLDAPIPDVRSVRGDVPKPLAAVITRCLAKTPDERYSSMADLEAALCEAQIASSLETSWDDLPLPEVEAARKEKLLRNMPDPHRLGRGSRRWPIFAVGALLAVAILVGAWLLRPPPAELSEIERLTIAAQAAAAEAYWVYPPADDPKRDTAYTKVLELEELDDGPADDAAANLRSEFADTLTRLGDEYWERPGGKPFAIDYYVQVLVFEPSHEVASVRARMTPGQLAVLQEKAQEQSFSEDELVAVEPLAALAEEDEAERTRKLTVLADRGEVASSTTANLEKLAGKPLVAVADDPPDPVEEPPPSEDEGAETGDEELVLGDEVPEDATSPDVAPTPESKRDRGRAKKLAKRGKKALSSGNRSEATSLFQKALAADDRNTEALIGLSRVFFDGGDYAKSARYARKAVRLKPRKAAYRIRLGDAYYKAYKFGEARAQYQEADKLGHPDAKGRLAKVKGKTGG